MYTSGASGVGDLDPRALRRDIDDLRRRVDANEQHAIGRQHVATTVPFGQSLSMQATHTGSVGLEFGMWVVPIDLRLPMQLKRVWSTVASTDGNLAEFCATLYRADQFLRERDNASRPVRLKKVRRLGTYGQTATAATRWTIDLDREELLDPAEASFFMGFQGNTKAEWHCPYGTLAHYPVRGFRTTSTIGDSSAIGDAPDTLSIPGGASATVTPPAFVLYSAFGISLYEDRTL